MESLVDQQLHRALLLNVYLVLAEHSASVILLFAVEAGADRLNILPVGVLPRISQKKLVLDRMEAESDVTIVDRAQGPQDGVLVLVVFSVSALLLVAKDGRQWPAVPLLNHLMDAHLAPLVFDGNPFAVPKR